MELVEITSFSGVGPYNVYACDITLSYCQLIYTSVTIPPTLSFTLTGALEGSSSVIIKVVDTSSGCQKFIPYYCPSATPTQTPTPTPTPTPISCFCISIENTSGLDNLNYTYTDCFGNVFSYFINNDVTIYVCGVSASGDEWLAIGYNGACIDYSCPSPPPTPTTVCGILSELDEFLITEDDYYIGQENCSPPTPTPTITPTPTSSSTPTPTPTPTPTQLPTSKVFQGGDNFIFMFGDYYIFENQ